MLKLKPGTTLSLAIRQDPRGPFELQPKLLVGKSAEKLLGGRKVCGTEEELWMALEAFAQDRLAKLGREKVP